MAKAPPNHLPPIETMVCKSFLVTDAEKKGLSSFFSKSLQVRLFWKILSRKTKAAGADKFRLQKKKPPF